MRAFRCRRCQTELRPNARFCDVCGYASSSDTVPPNLEQCGRLGATVTGPTGSSHGHDGLGYSSDAARVSAPGCSTPTTNWQVPRRTDHASQGYTTPQRAAPWPAQVPLFPGLGVNQASPNRPNVAEVGVIGGAHQIPFASEFDQVQTLAYQPKVRSGGGGPPDSSGSSSDDESTPSSGVHGQASYHSA